MFLKTLPESESALNFFNKNVPVPTYQKVPSNILQKFP